jgi:hypothetical protein
MTSERPLPDPHDSDVTTQSGSTTRERFVRVRAIFEAALERPEADRRGYIDGACGGQQALLQEVRAMLAADAKADALLGAQPSVSEHATTRPSSHEEGRFPAGTILAGRYRVLGMLGSGGMGEVYRAHDLKLEQQTALKFLPPAMANNARLLDRFRGEVRIARQVSHRNVCRVYDFVEIDGQHCGWLRGKEKFAKPRCSAQPGAKRKRDRAQH